MVLIHGGFWSVPWDRRLMNALSLDLVARGAATWNIDYVRLGSRRGGWPGTFDDVSAAVDHLADLASGHDLDLGRVVTAGHSAGGQLALWAAARGRLPEGVPGSGPRVPVAGALSLAGVVDLASADQNRVGGGVVGDLLGGHRSDQASRYELVSPIERLPLRVPHVLLHGQADTTVPPSQSVAHHAAAVALGDDCALCIVAGEDHMAVIDPSSASWAEALAWLGERRFIP